jgi:hypothetical protein
MYWLFKSNKTQDEVVVEADGFDEACNIMFGRDIDDEPYDYHEYEFIESSKSHP